MRTVYRSFLMLLAVAVVCGMIVCSDDDEPVDLLGNDPPPETETHRVPQDFATIQMAVDSAETLDTILLDDGVYTGEGNRDIIWPDKKLALISVNGPASTVIDCGSNLTEEHFAFSFTSAGDGSTLKGITIRNGRASGGGAIYILNADPIIENCVFVNNVGTTSGGAVRVKGALPTIRGCTFIGNSSMSGGAVFLIGNARPTIENCLITANTGGGSIEAADGTSVPTVLCSNIYGNTGGDWSDRSVSAQQGENGNLNLDPLICPTEGNFGIGPNSPCAPGNNSCGELIGALGVSCN